MHQVDLKLRSTGFLNDRVDLQPLGLGIIIDMLDHFLIFINGGERESLAAGGLPAGAAYRRLQRVIRVRVLFGEIEFNLRRNNRAEALGGVMFHHAAQDLTGRGSGVIAFTVKQIMDDQEGRIARPGHGTGGGIIRQQGQVTVRVEILPGHIGIIAVDRADQDGNRQPDIGALHEFGGGHNLAARDTGEIRSDAFNLVNAIGSDPFRQRGGIRLFQNRGMTEA